MTIIPFPMPFRRAILAATGKQGLHRAAISSVKAHCPNILVELKQEK
jgi:hypothetical protein